MPMKIREIALFGEPILRQIAQPIDDVTNSEVREINLKVFNYRHNGKSHVSF